MSTLLVEELQTTLTQTFSLNLDRRYVVHGIRPMLMMFGAPAGTFTFTLKSGGTDLGTASFTSADIKTDLSTSFNYAWLYKQLEFDNPVMLNNGSYSLVMSASGYTFSGTQFMGWLKEFDSPFFTINGGYPIDYADLPHEVQFFEKRRAQDMVVS